MSISMKTPDKDDPNEEPEDRDDTLLARHTPGKRDQRSLDQGNLPRDLTASAPPGGHANYPMNDPSELAEPPNPPGQPVAVSLW